MFKGILNKYQVQLNFSLCFINLQSSCDTLHSLGSIAINKFINWKVFSLILKM